MTLKVGDRVVVRLSNSYSSDAHQEWDGRRGHVFAGESIPDYPGQWPVVQVWLYDPVPGVGNPAPLLVNDLIMAEVLITEDPW